METVFLLPLLPDLGLEGEFSLFNPFFGKQGGPEAALRLELYHDSVLSGTVSVPLRPTARFIHSRMDPAADALLKTARPGDLAVLRFGDASGKPVPVDPGQEGQIFLRSRRDGSYATVITGMVPSRPVGYKFSPIVHFAHYLRNSPEFCTYMVFANFGPHAPGASPEGNRFRNKLISHDGRVVKEFDFTAPFNSTHVVSVREAAAGTDQEGKDHVVLISKGGASQFSIFTVFRSDSTGQAGIEHSLAPMYYTRCLGDKAARETYYKLAFQSP